jgi:multidrug efflux system membrane fusion protein
MFKSTFRLIHAPQKPSYRAALVILVLVILWIGSGFIFGGQKAASGDAQAKTVDMPRVRVQILAASDRDATITIRGRTQALHSVDVRAEIEGVVQALRVEKGDRVKAGDVLCEIKLNDRGPSSIRRVRWWRKRPSSMTSISISPRTASAPRRRFAIGRALEAARATQQTMEIELANTKIKRAVRRHRRRPLRHVGDYMRVGDKCAMIVAPEPFLAVGQVSEHEVGELKIGDPARHARHRRNRPGQDQFRRLRADDTTRTFRIEVELPNPDAKLRAGISADIHIPVRQLKAEKISPGILVLDDNGVVGVRTVEHGIVRFHPVDIVSDGPDGMWVSGLSDGIAVITSGRNSSPTANACRRSGTGAARMIRIVDWAVNNTRVVVALLAVAIIAGLVSFVGDPEGSQSRHSDSRHRRADRLSGHQPGGQRAAPRQADGDLSALHRRPEDDHGARLSGRAVIILEFDVNFNKEKALEDVRAQVETARAELPQDAKQPTVQEFNTSLFPRHHGIALSGDVPERTMLKIARDLKDQIKQIPSVLDVNIGGERQEMLEIVIDPSKLESYGITQQECSARSPTTTG